MKKLLLMCLLALPALGEVPISALPDGAALTGVEQVPAVQSGVTVKTTPAAISTYVEANGAAGADTQLQYNNAGAFGAESGLTWESTLDALMIQGAYPRMRISETGVAANSGNWQIEANANLFQVCLANDAWAVSNCAFGISRTGTSIDSFSASVGATSLLVDTNGFTMSGNLEWHAVLTGNSNLAQLDLDNNGTNGVAALETDGQTYVVGPEVFLLGSPMWKQSSTAPVIASSGTIDTTNVGVARLAPAGAVTGVIIEAGTAAGQQIIVVNQSAAVNSITMAASGTSNVANGVTCNIAGLQARGFVWNSATSLWYEMK